MLDFFPAVSHRRLMGRWRTKRWLLRSVLLGLAVVIALYPTASSQLQSITFSQQWIDLAIPRQPAFLVPVDAIATASTGTAGVELEHQHERSAKNAEWLEISKTCCVPQAQATLNSRMMIRRLPSVPSSEHRHG
jgi:hypothetical protein